MTSRASYRALPLSHGAAAILLPRLHDVFACEEATRAGDPEKGIHDMRVATKRLREVVRLFEDAFRKKAYRKHHRWIEDLNDALGGVRDLDVLLATLRERVEGTGAEPAGMAGLVARLKRQRDGARTWLLWQLDRLRDRALPAKLEECLAEMSHDPDPDQPRVEEFARAAILERVTEVRERWERVRLDAQPRTFHRVRIANKRLRYAIEPFREWLPEPVWEVYRVCSKFHDALGDMHDEDVLLHRLETEMCLAAEDDRGAWEVLHRDAETRRRQRLRKTLRLADKLLGLEGWDRMEAALRRDQRESEAQPMPPAEAGAIGEARALVAAAEAEAAEADSAEAPPPAAADAAAPPRPPTRH